MRFFDTNLLKVLGCPTCKQKLELRNEKLFCNSCEIGYPIVDGIPILHVKKDLYDKKYYEDGGLVSGGSKRSKPAKFIRNVMKKTTPTCRVIAKRAKKVIFSCFKDISLTNSERVVLNIGPAKTTDIEKTFQRLRTGAETKYLS